MCGLGVLPTSYSQNTSECLNRYVKEKVKCSGEVTGSLVKVVKNISSVVKCQFEKQFLAVIGKETCRLTEQFQFLHENESANYRMSRSQKDRVTKLFHSFSF